MSLAVDLDACMPDEARVGEIKKHLSEYNADRPGIHKAANRDCVIYLAGYVLVAIVVIIGVFNIGIENLQMPALMLAAIGGYYVFDYARKPIKDHQLSLRYRLFPQIFAFIDDVNYSHGREPDLLFELRQLKLVDFTSTENDDLIKGTHNGLTFDLVETKMIRGSGKHKETVFRGLIFRFKLKEPFDGVLMASRRGGWLERTWKEMWRTTTIGEIKSGNLRLDETHSFRTSNRSAAAPIIAGPLTSVLTWMGNEWHGGDVRIALAHGYGYLMLPADRDYFSLPDITQDVDYAGDVKPIVREMATLLGIAHMMRSLG